MKISILTPVYNRAKTLERLYKSLLQNSGKYIEIEWLIMNDGSTDDSALLIEKFLKEEKITIKYFYQENQGKMAALNHLALYATGDVMIECDSDDMFTKNAFQIILEKYPLLEMDSELYALSFLKYDLQHQNIGNNFPSNQYKSTMFELYFKENVVGEKALVFKTEIRKQYQYKIEEGEKFSTEARMYHQMDLDFKILCFNIPLMLCEYQPDGYTKNIHKIFQENPKGHFAYFQEMFLHKMKGISFSKRLYIIKHYILFTTLTHQKKAISSIKGLYNKILYLLLYIPGKIKTQKQFQPCYKRNSKV